MVIPERDIENLCDQLHATGQKIVFTNGCFDILHAGHVRYLQSAACFGDCLIIGLNSDRSVRNLKGAGRPLNGEQDRAEVLGALKAVDYVVIFDEPTAENLIKKVMPDIYVKGGDYTMATLPETEIIQSYGGRIELMPLVEGRSSSNLIKKIQAIKDVEK